MVWAMDLRGERDATHQAPNETDRILRDKNQMPARLKTG